MKNIIQIFLLVMLAGQIFAQNPFQVNCPSGPQTFGDQSSNNINLWNETYWYDLQNNIVDMPEGPVNLHIVIADTCTNLHVRYLLSLDLDQNGTLETLVDSDSLPGYNNVMFGNLLSGGTPRAFDERVVDLTEKYGFALQTTIFEGETTANLRWNTVQIPNTYVIPELPYGTHNIKWIVSDACGNESSCEYNFVVKDVKPPTVVTHSLTINALPAGQAQIYAVDFLIAAVDNASPTASLKYGVREQGTGAGFPLDSLGNPITSIFFDCSQLGLHIIDVWAMDLAGNVDFATTYVDIQDNTGFCSNQVQEITTCINFWKDGSPMQAEISLPGGNSISYNSSGCAVALVDTSSNFTIIPTLDTDPLNGVNALDIIRISAHILGIKPLDTYSLIAADVNKSGSITAFDIQELKKLLVGIYTTFPNNTSWRFVDASFHFPDPTNPFQPQPPENPTYIAGHDTITHFNLIGIKVGDIDGSAYPGFGAPNEDRATAVMTLPDALLLPGETVDLPLRMQTNGEWLGLQMGLQFDPQLLEVEVQNTENLPNWDASSWATPKPGLLNMVWFDTQPKHWRSDENVLTLRVRALVPVHLQEALRLTPGSTESGIKSTAVTAGGDLQSLQLAFEKSNVLDGATTVFAPQPNPTTGVDVQIPVRLAQDETVTLQLADLTGRILFENSQVLTQGSHLLTVPTTAFSQNGVYLWRIQAGATVASGKVVKI